ncbi:MAG: hypothetical protein MZV49_11930 [Rhodopseudomonas palustris]|nr:hypothetical protein [Rhodopseudomonas palustris]
MNEGEAPAAALDDAVVRARVDALLAQMTVEEKAGQITQYFDFLTSQDEAKRVEAEVAAEARRLAAVRDRP